jgi:hypothetical protein
MKLLQYFCYAYNYSKFRLNIFISVTWVSKSKSYIFVLGNEADMDEAMGFSI